MLRASGMPGGGGIIIELSFGHIPGYTYQIPIKNVSIAAFEQIAEFFVPRVRAGAAKGREVISQAFQLAVRLCPEANHSDIWHHILYRLYVENVTGTSQPSQSWVRTSGDAFEHFLCVYYNSRLAPFGLRINPLFSRLEKQRTIERLDLVGKVGSSKIDILVERKGAGAAIGYDGFGVVGVMHAKASFAERISDDAPCSRLLMGLGYKSLLVSLDVKSFPPPHGDLVNRGELGTPTDPSDKRQYVEWHGDFDGLISYNRRSVPSVRPTLSGKEVVVCAFDGAPVDAFIDFWR